MAAFAAAALTMMNPSGWTAKNPSTRELDKKLKTHKKDLEQIQEQIKNLEDERERLKQDEESLSKTVKNLETNIEKSTRKQVKQRRMIQDTEGRIGKLAGQITLLTHEGHLWENAVFTDMKAYHEDYSFPSRLEMDAMKAWALRAVIASKLEKMKNTQSKRAMTYENEQELLRAKAKMVQMKAELEKEIQGQKKSKEEKAKLHKTTQGKRIIAEQEVQQLNDTREALEKLISTLAEKKKKTLEAEREAQVMKKSFQEKKASLPWPVSGEVTSFFGRQKHPDLNITVIHNGIRIKTAAGQPVKSVEKGTVIYASDFRSYGPTVIVDHGGDMFSVYGLLGEIAVKEGEKVPAGKALGSVSDEGQIYFEIKSQGRSENPILWLSRKTSISKENNP